MVEVVEQFVSQTALALQNAWLLAQVRGLAATDSLTGIANRRTFDTELVRELSRADRSGSALALIIVDIDHFKAHNDANGHQEGDRTLQRVAAVLQDGGRATDTVARYGGEEFVVLLPGSDAVDRPPQGRALPPADREPARTASRPASASRATRSTAPTARASSRPPTRALYESKRAGRNRVSIAWRPVAPRPPNAVLSRLVPRVHRVEAVQREDRLAGRQHRSVDRVTVARVPRAGGRPGRPRP